MLSFSPCKINLGLHVVEKREDGYHNLETSFYPINWTDAIEVLESSDNQEFELKTSGLRVEGDLKDNIIYKAYLLLKEQHPIPPIKVILHKVIPMGAGLGGGSSNAATFINLVNSKFNLNIPIEERRKMASKLGSDCAFFIESTPVYATQKGNVFEPLHLDLSKYHILIVYPAIHSNTGLAYKGVTPKASDINLKHVLETMPVKEWKHHLKNDFEGSVIKAYPEIGEVKQTLYDHGALYACMSGSGSAVFGIFEKEPNITWPSHYSFHVQRPSN